MANELKVAFRSGFEKGAQSNPESLPENWTKQGPKGTTLTDTGVFGGAAAQSLNENFEPSMGEMTNSPDSGTITSMQDTLKNFGEQSDMQSINTDKITENFGDAIGSFDTNAELDMALGDMSADVNNLMGGSSE